MTSTAPTPDPGGGGVPLGRRLGVIAFLTVGMVTAVVLVGGRVGGAPPAPAASGPVGADRPIPAEAAAFDGARSPAGVSRDREPLPGQARTLAAFYRLRAYPGAPPVIPHDVDPERDRAPRCNACHEKGGFAPTLEAYAPLTPHAAYANCLQCHVRQRDGALFTATDWRAAAPPPIHVTALDGSPPVVPHPLQMRENCMACHAGPSAVEEVRTSHPERIHCRQCHVPAGDGAAFQRERAGS